MRFEFEIFMERKSINVNCLLDIRDAFEDLGNVAACSNISQCLTS